MRTTLLVDIVQHVFYNQSVQKGCQIEDSCRFFLGRPISDGKRFVIGSKCHVLGVTWCVDGARVFPPKHPSLTIRNQSLMRRQRGLYQTDISARETHIFKVHSVFSFIRAFHCFFRFVPYLGNRGKSRVVLRNFLSIENRIARYSLSSYIDDNCRVFIDKRCTQNRFHTF